MSLNRKGKRTTLLNLLSEISAAYQLNEITQEEKNRLCELAKLGLNDGFEVFYDYCKGLEGSAVEEMIDIVLFQG